MHFSFLSSVHLTTQILLCFQLSCWSFLLAFPRNIKDFYYVNLLLLASRFPQPLLKHGKRYTLLPHVQISVQPLKSYLSNCLYPASSRCVHYNYSHCLSSWCDVVLCCQSTSSKQGWGERIACEERKERGIQPSGRCSGVSWFLPFTLVTPKLATQITQICKYFFFLLD